MIDQRVPPAVIAQLLVPRSIASAELIPPGMSGAIVFHCRDRSGSESLLRRWPPDTKRSRIQQIHKVITVARKSGCSIVPLILGHDAQGQGLFYDRPWYWELSQWMPGEPLDDDASIDQIRSGAAAIASFHRAVRCLGVTLKPPPAATVRVLRANELDHLLPATLAQHPRSFTTDTPALSRSIGEACQLLRTDWPEASRRIARSLTRYERVDVETQYVLRDVHRQHVFFQEGTVSGLIDFDAVRVDTPMTDLARWVGSFRQGRAEAAWEAALAGYCENSPSFNQRQTDHQQVLAQQLCYATTWISLANWVIWVVSERRSFPCGPLTVATRIDELVRFAIQET